MLKHVRHSEVDILLDISYKILVQHSCKISSLLKEKKWQSTFLFIFFHKVFHLNTIPEDNAHIHSILHDDFAGGLGLFLSGSREEVAHDNLEMTLASLYAG